MQHLISQRKVNHVVFQDDNMAGKGDSAVEFVQIDGLVSHSGCTYYVFINCTDTIHAYDHYMERYN